LPRGPASGGTGRRGYSVASPPRVE
jgi:hypothetical protein